MSDAKAPHKAILSVNVEIHEVLPTGECSGNTVPENILKEMGVKEHYLLSVDGFDRFDCIKRLLEKLRELDNDA